MADFHITRNWSLTAKIAHYSKPGPNGCVLWTSSKNTSGYAILWWGKRKRRVHRLIWEAANGPISPNQFVCHTCDTPACINLDHLWVGSHADNMTDMKEKGRGAQGERHGSAKLTAAQVLEIRASKETLQCLAERFQINIGTLSEIRSRKLWTHLQG